MPRIARALTDNCYCHIINRGNGRQQIFHKDGDFQAFTALMQTARDLFPVKLLAWCLMPNHFHLIVQPTVAEHLSQWMHWIMTSHVRRYHQHYRTSGHVWQGRYKSFLIQDSDHLLTALRYVEANPVRAQLVESASQWRWSSHVSRESVCEGLQPDVLPFSLPEGWSVFVDAPMTDVETEKFRNSVNRQTPFGEEDWRDAMCGTMGLESTLRLRGWQKGRKRNVNKMPVPL